MVTFWSKKNNTIAGGCYARILVLSGFLEPFWTLAAKQLCVSETIYLPICFLICLSIFSVCMYIIAVLSFQLPFDLSLCLSTGFLYLAVYLPCLSICMTDAHSYLAI